MCCENDDIIKWKTPSKHAILACCVCLFFNCIEILFCNNWQYWHISFRFIWIIYTYCIAEYNPPQYARILRRSFDTCELVILLLISGGSFTIVKMLLFFYKDLNDIVHISTQNESDATLFDILLIMLQLSYIRSFCYPLILLHRMYYDDSYKCKYPLVEALLTIMTSTIPYFSSFFVVMICPSTEMIVWLLGIRLYWLLRAVLLFVLNLLPGKSKHIQEIKDYGWGLCDFILNGLCVARLVYFTVFIAPWMMVPLCIIEIHSSASDFGKYIVRGTFLT